MRDATRLSGPVTPSTHAMTRFAVHHPGATRGDLQLAVGLGERIEPTTAQFLVGRGPARSRSTDVYVLARDRRGLFVLAPLLRSGWLVVTYLRFGPSQAVFAVSQWAVEALPNSKAVRPEPLRDTKEAA